MRDHQRWLSGKGLFYCINSPLGDITDITDYDFETDASDIFVRGAGETSSYLNTIRKELLQELVPRFPGLDRNKELYQAMEETNSVCISVRRGDYFSNPGVKEKFALCDREYFVRAVEKVKELVAQPVFFIFSDDIEWCRENLNLDVSDCFFERGDDPIWEKLRMMYSCKHFIISNSTFSWWAQWLGTFPGKVVVSPDRWYVKYTSALVEESFYRIQTGK